MKDRRERRRKGGFTLIEVLLVLVILVILGSLGVTSYMSAAKKAKLDAAKAGMALLKTPLEMYCLHMGDYPPSLEALIQQPPDGAGRWAGPYIEKLPVDPWGHPYNYQGGGGGYQISAAGPDGVIVPD
jgi:general secretion pathway protein G